MTWKGESRRHSMAKKGIKTASGLVTGTVYRGTTAGTGTDFKTRYRPKEQLGFGIHFTEDLELAEKYAYDPKVSRVGKNPHIHRAILHMENPLIANKIYYEGEPEFDLAFEFAKGTGYRVMADRDERGIRGLYLQNHIDLTSPQRAERIIKEHGYDGVVYTAKLIETPDVHGMGRLFNESTTYIVFDASQIEIIGG